MGGGSSHYHLIGIPNRMGRPPQIIELITMKLSELFGKVQAAGDVLSYTAFLATPDSDGLDVDLASIGRVEIRTEDGEVRIYPASTQTDADSVEPEPFLGMLMDELPADVSDG